MLQSYEKDFNFHIVRSEYHLYSGGEINNCVIMTPFP
jgi:hypothetical protein